MTRKFSVVCVLEGIVSAWFGIRVVFVAYFALKKKKKLGKSIVIPRKIEALENCK